MSVPIFDDVTLAVNRISEIANRTPTAILRDRRPVGENASVASGAIVDAGTPVRIIEQHGDSIHEAAT